MLVGFDEGEALNYLQNYSISGAFTEESWRNSVDSLVSSNFRTTQARQYIGQFIPFLYQNWINQPEEDTQACPKFKSKILQVCSIFIIKLHNFAGYILLVFLFCQIMVSRSLSWLINNFILDLKPENKALWFPCHFTVFLADSK